MPLNMFICTCCVATGVVFLRQVLAAWHAGCGRSGEALGLRMPEVAQTVVFGNLNRREIPLGGTLRAALVGQNGQTKTPADVAIYGNSKTSSRTMFQSRKRRDLPGEMRKSDVKIVPFFRYFSSFFS